MRYHVEARSELKSFLFNKSPTTIHFATRDENNALIIEVLSAEKLPIYIAQSFKWEEKIIINNENQTISCCLFKILLDRKNISIEEIKKKMMENKKGIIFCKNRFYYIKQLKRNGHIVLEINKEQEEKLKPIFLNMQEDTCQIANLDELKLIKSALGHNLSKKFFRDTISSEIFEKRMMEVRETQHKLAIIKVNDTVGYGVIAIDDILPETTLTYYSGVCSIYPKSEISDDYAIGNSIVTISAKDYRNFAGFITHAFKSKPLNDFGDEVTLEDFSPIFKEDENLNGMNISLSWRASILSANVFQENAIYKHIPYIFFTNPERISKDSILAWDYGIGYWQSRHTFPSLLTLEGKIIDPSIYVCKKSSYNAIAPNSLINTLPKNLVTAADEVSPLKQFSVFNKKILTVNESIHTKNHDHIAPTKI